MRTNRFLAVLLAATMVFGSTVTAFATEPDTGVATGTGTAVDGQGASEGYVNTTVLKVVLPTTTKETFAFIMDPQEMLAQTNGARLGSTWTQPKSDTYVYFKTAKGYANKSDTVYFINKSTDQKLDVTVKAVVTDATGENVTAIPLDTAENAKHSVTASAKLYLGLTVGGITKALTNAADGTTTIVAADNAHDEYTVVYNTKTKDYEYAEKTGAAFKAVPISVEGSVTHFATEAKAPKLTLTWSWKPQADSGQEANSKAVNYVTSDAYTVSGATLDQTGSDYGSFVNKIGPNKGGKLTLTGTSATITTPYTISKIQVAKDGTNFSDNSNSNLSFKAKAVTIKSAFWNPTTASDFPTGAKIKVIFADQDGDTTTTNDTPDAWIFEKP